MTVKYEYNEESKLLLVEASGILTSKEIRDYLGELVNENVIKPDTVEIVDLNSAEDFVLTFSDLEDISKTSKSLLENGHKVTLMCAYNKLSSQIVKMMLPLFHSISLNVVFCSNEKELEKLKNTLL